MKKIVGIGANVCDTLITLSEYPIEDTKIKAETIIKSGGGPCATALVTSAKLGVNCVYIGNLANDNEGKFLYNDLVKYSVSTECVDIIEGCSSFCSYVLLNEKNGTRTCVFHRGNVQPTVMDERRMETVKNADILLVDGNDLQAAIDAAKIAKENGVLVLYDAGGLYDGVEELLKLTDILIPSQEFVFKITNTDNVNEAAKILYEKYAPQVVVITCGKDGGIIFDGRELKKYPSFRVLVKDSNGAGDVFHGAFAYALTNDMSYYDACVFSSAVSAIKCTKIGAREGTPSLSEVELFLKERGINV